MKYSSEYRDKNIIANILTEIRKISKKEITLMEVCGGHTMSIQKFGIPSLLPKNIKLVSGPGCPVCVSSMEYLDKAIYLAQQGNIVCTYGDLIRVPGSNSTLDKEKAKGADVRIVYSTLDAIQIAKENPEKKVIFLAIGFETTTPPSAAAVLEAEKLGINNFFILSSHKLMPPAMRAIIHEGIKIDGYIAPGHVSTITGTSIYDFIPDEFNLACVISGFEAVDILQSVLMLVKQIENDDQKVEIQYKRAVRNEGNPKAQEIVNMVFEPCDENWRGVGVLGQSGLKLRKDYENYDAEIKFNFDIPASKEVKGCICGDILKGLKTPRDCKLFAKACTPANPIGACMVSAEGACAAYFKYNRI